MIRKAMLAAAGLFALAALVLVASSALASPPTGQHPGTPVIGTLADITQVNTDRIKLQTKGATDIAMFTVTYDPSGFSGWHTHPGFLFVTVQSGSVTRTVGCSSRTYGPGETFVESDEQAVGAVANASATDPAVLSVTQIVPHGSPRRVEADAPTC
jgi:quercetin dioxygenase-like cupin family protein